MRPARENWAWWAVCVCCCLVVASAAGDSRCSSWRFNVEVNNLRDWTFVPRACQAYVTHYILGGQYWEDSAEAMEQARSFAHQYSSSSSASSSSASASSAASNFSHNAWVFDVDETSLSNVPFFVRYDFGPEAYNATLAEEWVKKGIAPALPATLALFKEVKDLGYSVFILTGRYEQDRNVTASNLRRAGYHNWNGLIMRQSGDRGVKATLFKSRKRKALEKLGYTIVGNVGDQWSDLTGYSVGSRVFKLPNPLYYVA